MTRGKKIGLLTGGVVLGVALIAKAFKSAGPPLEPPPPYSFVDHRLRLDPQSKLLGRLEILRLDKVSEENMALRSVGQIIALSNTSGNLTGNPVGWVELDPKTSSSLGLHFGDSAALQPGVAYGWTAVSDEYASDIRPGQPVEIMRYGLRKSGTTGVISKVLPKVEGGQIDIIFRFGQAQDWFPGTNCEVAFPHLQGHPIRIPTTAPIHVGTREYVWKETGTAEFAAQSVSVVDATPDEVLVLGLKPGDRIVTRGAILLKPLLEPLLSGPKEKG